MTSPPTGAAAPSVSVPRPRCPRSRTPAPARGASPPVAITFGRPPSSARTRRTSVSTRPALPHTTPTRRHSSVVLPSARSRPAQVHPARAARRGGTAPPTPSRRRARWRRPRRRRSSRRNRAWSRCPGPRRSPACRRACAPRTRWRAGRRPPIMGCVHLHRHAGVLRAQLDRQRARSPRAAPRTTAASAAAPPSTRSRPSPRRSRARVSSSATRSSSAVERPVVRRQKPSSSGPRKRPTTVSLLPMSTASSGAGARLRAAAAAVRDAQSSCPPSSVSDSTIASDCAFFFATKNDRPTLTK